MNPILKHYLSFFLLVAAQGGNADVIQGVVTAAADNSPLSQVKVSLDSAHFTFTGTDGSFTLNTAVTSVGKSFPPALPKADWNPEQALLSWTGTSGNVSVEVRDVNGTLAARSPRSCCADSRFSLRGLPQGVYLATLRTSEGAVTKKIFQEDFHGVQASFNPRDLIQVPILLKSAKTLATDSLTFSKPGYTPVKRVISGSQSGLIVQMQIASKIQTVFVIAMENTDATSIYGNHTNAPYINDSIIPVYGNGSKFGDELPLSIVSEPHYVWMEAGTNAFSDHTFTDDADPSSTVTTASTEHLATQIRNAGNGSDWRAYQEDINTTTGACPIATSGFYAPKHNPFVFFGDVTGTPPSKTNAYCAAHHKPLSALAGDLASVSVPRYNFITPNQCNDMHGQSGCPAGNTILAGDNWLRANLPPLIAFAKANAGVIFITWDEGSATSQMAFLIVGPGVKPGYTSTLTYTHSSMLKSVERILQLPILSTVSASNDFSDFFLPNAFP